MSARLAILEKFASENPEDPFYPYAIAMEFLSMDKPSEAKVALLKVQKKFPDYLPVYYILANTLFEAGDSLASLEIARQGMDVAKQQNATKTWNELRSFIEITLEA